MSPGATGPKLVVAMVLSLLAISCFPAPERGVAVEFVGRAACAECHAGEAAAWEGSHHDLAMQPVEASTVLGDFDDATFVSGRDTTTFFRRDGAFLVRTAGPDGGVGEFEAAYTFGVEPLQQYLIEFPGGRYQALSIAWDARPADDGGQGWFHLYPDATPEPGDPLHWTGRDQTWNYQCAECHSTDLNKNYDPATDTYETTWSEVDVSCEACHGPGSEHVRWAEAAGPDAQLEADAGGILSLGASDPGDWQFEPGAMIARRSTPRPSDALIETCARCHSRRGALHDDYTHGEPLLETHRVALLDEGLYHADGQIQDEVYVYGSFLQSRMYRMGVTCTDCHDPHTAGLVAEGDALCTRCHLPTEYDTPGHHFHPEGSPGAECVECHMPAQTYMEIDPRRDHGFRIPRPDVAAEIGAPDACTTCHTDQGPEWAASELDRRLERAPGGSHFGQVLHAARRGDPQSAAGLATLALDTAQAEIVRATAASLLGRVATPTTDRAIRGSLGDPSPLVRLGALGALEGRALEANWRFALILLSDPIRAVRLEAARRLAAIPRETLSSDEAAEIDRGVDAYFRSQLVNAERPEAHLNISVVHAGRGSLIEARTAIETALGRDSTFIPAYLNLADIFRAGGVESEAESMLRRGLEIAPDDPGLHHSLGLTLVRRQDLSEALPLLRRATEIAPENARYGYVYAIALNSTGDGTGAIEALERARDLSPFDADLLVALTTISRDLGRVEAAIGYAQELADLRPGDASVQELLAQLRSLGRGSGTSD